MAAQRPYRQRSQYLTPTAWELNWTFFSFLFNLSLSTEISRHGRVYILFKPSQTCLNRFEKFNGSGHMYQSNEVVKRLIILKVKNLHHCFSFVRKRNDSILILLKTCQVWKDFRLKFLMTSKGQKVQGSNHIDGNQVSWCSPVQVPLRLCWKYSWIHIYIILKMFFFLISNYYENGRDDFKLINK